MAGMLKGDMTDGQEGESAQGVLLWRGDPHTAITTQVQGKHMSAAFRMLNQEPRVSTIRERENTQEMTLRRIQTPLSYNWQLYFQIRKLQCFRTKQSIRAKNKSQLNQYTVFEFNSRNVAATAVAEGRWNPTWNKKSKSLYDNNNKINNKLLEIISFLQ